MIENSSGTVRSVVWTELFPWLNIVRTFRMAISPRMLILGAIGALLTATGWFIIGGALSGESQSTQWTKDYFSRCPWTAVTDDIVPNRPGEKLGCKYQTPQVAGDLQPIPADKQQPSNPMLAVWTMLTQPATAGLSPKQPGWKHTPFKSAVCVLLCGLWAVAVWALFGAAICRMAAVQLAADEHMGMFAALRFAWKKWPSYCAAPLLPVGGALGTAAVIAVLGWLMYALSGVGMLLGAVLWPLVLIAAFVMALLLLGVLFGWPLMWGTISAEGSDSFDALSRSYAYTFQKPLHYLFYVIVASIIGWLGWLLVREFAAGVVWLGYWSAGWGCGASRIAYFLDPNKYPGGASGFAVHLVHFWAGCVKLLAVGFLFSFFFSASAAIYFLLRRDVDAAELAEVFLDADQSEPAPSLPEIVADSAGAPVVKEEDKPEGC
jgi:hypothetical protein